MSFSYDDIEAYAFGFAAVLVIYAVIEWGLPALFGRAKKLAAPVVAPVAAKITEAMKPVFPFPSTPVAGAEALAAFDTARKGGAKGVVIFGWGKDQLSNLAHGMSFRKETPQQILAMADAKPEPFPSKSKPKQPVTWPVVGPFKMDRVPFLASLHPDGFKPEVSIVTTPAADDAEILAHLKFGGWNACPEPYIHVAMMRKWQRDYGAELVAFSHDAMDVRVKRRPQTQAEALMLARAHLKYCPSNETTIAETAAELMETDWWHFWWD
jgi:hypothetical protein